MYNFGDIILLCWAILIFYWAINWRKVKPTKERQFDIARFRVLGIIIITLFIAAARTFHIIPACNPNTPRCNLIAFFPANANFQIQILGVLFTIVGLIIAVLARKTLADNWSNTIELKKGHKLITNGIYGYVRHPIYLGFLLMGLGALLYIQSPIVFIIFLIVFGIFALRIKSEEKLMTKTFPIEYPKYKKHVKAFIPFIW